MGIMREIEYMIESLTVKVTWGTILLWLPMIVMIIREIVMRNLSCCYLKIGVYKSSSFGRETIGSPLAKDTLTTTMVTMHNGNTSWIAYCWI